MENEFTLKRYNSIAELTAASMELESADLIDAEVVGVTEDGQEVPLSFEQQQKAIEDQGYWGWVDDEKVIHYWVGKDVPMEDLIHFFAHEIGHRVGNPIEDHMREEVRAETYGFAAALAYKFAKSLTK